MQRWKMQLEAGGTGWIGYRGSRGSSWFWYGGPGDSQDVTDKAARGLRSTLTELPAAGAKQPTAWGDSDFSVVLQARSSRSARQARVAWVGVLEPQKHRHRDYPCPPIDAGDLSVWQWLT